ncbi:hypothetical protein BASA81_007851 [Batrachochytrium salamandrivorans]|nr:hypothetical protein BASA81_007851 [Batrachochytrium salamandrivorans]
MAKKSRVDEEEEEEEVIAEATVYEDFAQLDMDPRLASVMDKEFSISQLFPLQKHAIQLMLEEEARDVAISAPTGSGKTLMYSLPLIHALANRIVTRCRGLVLCPSRDLAKQVHLVVLALGQAVGLTVVLIAGESSLFQEGKLLQASEQECLCDVVVATPGRLLDHLAHTKGFSLEHLEYLICDEADRLLNQSYQDWLDRVYQYAYSPHSQTNPRTFSHTRQVYTSQDTILRKVLCSATLTKNPEKLYKLAMFHPLLIQDDSTDLMLPPTLVELAYRVTLEDKPLVLLHLLSKVLQQTSQRVVVFCSSVIRAERVHALCASAFTPSKCRVIVGSKATQERAKLLLDFKLGKFPILVGSDLAARGIDIPNLDMVISYDVPAHASTYVHRSGRTARAGAEGTSIVLLQNIQARHFRQIKAKVGSKDKFQFADVGGAGLFDEWLPVLAKWKQE